MTGAEANKCPGVPVLVQAGETTVALNFTGSTDSYTSKSCSLPILSNKDMVLALSAAESGMVNASLKLSGGTSATLYVRSECEIKASEITCKQGAFSQVAQVSFSLASGQVLYLLVEGAADSKSMLTLTFTPG